MITFETARRSISFIFFFICLIATSLLPVAAHPERALTGVDTPLFSSGGPAHPDSGHEIVFITDDVEEWEILAAAVRPDTEVVRLDRNADGVDEIAAILKDRRGLEGIHIVSHGAAGQITLGSKTLSDGNIDQNLRELEMWGRALNPSGAIFLYGCDVAWGDIGRQFVERLARRTHAKIAASSNPTGTERLSGDWQLEVRTGTVHDVGVFDIARVKSYDHILQTTLSAGDAVVLSISQSTNTFKWAPLKDLSAGTVIKFTDRGWINGNTFFATGANEGFFSLTLGSTVSAGTVGSVTIATGNVTLSGITGTTSVSGWTGTVGIGTPGGDTLFLYDGSESSPNFIFGVNFTGVAADQGAWSTNTAAQTNSLLPSGLTNGVNATALRKPDITQLYSWAYTGPVTAANAATWLSRIVGDGTEPANWTGPSSSDPATEFGSSLSILTATAPTITAVSIPNAAMKIGDTVTATITVTSDTDNYTTGSGGISGNIGGFTLGSLSRINATTYTATFTVTSGGTDVAAGSNIPLSVTLTNSTGNASTAFTTAISQGGDPIDANRPAISAVSIPNAAMKIGDTVTATITVSSDSDTYTLGSSNIGGFTLGSLSKTNNTTYTATFTVTSGGTDVAAGSNIPLSVTLTDSAGNASTAFTTAISQGGDPIDANRPAISAVSIPNAAMKIGDTVTATITVSSDSDTYTLGSSNIGGFTLGSLSKTNNTTYTATFTVTSGGTDVAVGSNIPLSVTLTDSAGNASTAFTTAISQGSDPIDANRPAISAVSIPNAAMKIGDTVTATITVSSDSDTYTLGSSNIGGFTLGSLSKTNNTTYTATFTVTSGGTDVAAGSNIPLSVTLTDSAGNASTAFTTAISQGGDPIDANRPAISAVSIPNAAMKIGDTVTATITVSSDSDTYTLGSSNIGGFTLGSLSKTNNTTYTATFTVTSGGTDVAVGSNIPLSVTLTDSAGNASTAFTTAISQASDRIDANRPAISAVSIPNVTMNLGDVVTATITVTSDTDNYTTGSGGISGNIGGYTLGSLSRTNATTYTATFTIAAGSDVAAGSNIPISVTLTDSAGNASTAFTTAISQGSDPIFANAYTVTYNGNSNTGGTVPTDSSSPYLAGATVTVLSNSGSLVRTGFTFAGWNTAADGSGTDRAATGSATFTIGSANVVLYAKWTANTYTVTYNGNSNTGGAVPTDSSSPYLAGATVTVLANTGSLVRTGFTFTGWNTAADGSGTDHAATGSATFTIGSANVVLYAKWTANTYTVTYNGNSNTGGSAPTDSSSPYLAGATVTVLSNTGSLVRTGFTFTGWNTAADGSGTDHAATGSATFTIGSANVVLYAKWTANTYTVTYNGNSNTGGSAPTDSSSPYLVGATVTVLANSGTLVRTGYTFAGWNTAADGSGTDRAATGSATFTIGSANVVLYAKWTANTYTVTYNGNSNTGGAVPTDSSSPYLAGATVTVLANSGTLVRTGYTFAGWNTAADGSGTDRAATGSATFTIGSANVVLYAKWTANTYTVTYNGNSNTGGAVPTDSSSPYLAGATVTVLANTGSLVRTGFTFTGWNTAADGSGTDHAATGSATFTIGSANVVLYAKWTANTYTVTYNGNSNTGGSAPTDSSSPYLAGATVTVLSNTGSLVRTGFTFAGWNTEADGSGTDRAATGSATFTIGSANVVLYAKWTDAAAPTVTDSAISLNSTLFKDGGTITVSWNNTSTGDNNNDVASVTVNFAAFGGGAAVAATNNSGTWTASATVSLPAGGANLNVSVRAVDTNGNAATTFDSSNATVDNTPPTLSISAPSGTLTRTGPVTYAITYSGQDSVTLATGDITLNKTNSANGSFSVSGSGSTRTVTISSITGDGTLGISIAAGTAADTAGNTAAAAGPSTTFTIDNTAPTVTSIVRQSPTAATTNADAVTFRVTFNEGVQNVDAADFSVAGTAAADGSVGTVSAVSALVYDVPVNGITNSNGTIGLAFAAGQNIADIAGNALTNTTPETSEQYTIDNTAPTLGIGAPSAADTVSGPVTYTITYSGADSVTLATGNITLNTTGTATGAVAVSGTGTATRTVTISSITGDGTLGISIAAASATDTAGNSAAASSASTIFNVDNIVPSFSIGAPSTTLTRGGPVTYTVTYNNANSVTLAAGNITLNKAGTANGAVDVSGTGTSTRTVTISSITGDGTLGISIAAGTASDTAGNTAAASTASTTFNADNTAPTVTDPRISLNKAIFKDGATVTATWNNSAAGDNNSDVAAVTMDFSAFGGGTAVVATNTAGIWSASAAVALPAGGTNLNISVKATDTAGNQAATADTSNATVDNIAPTLTIGPPSGTTTSAGPISYAVIYTGADTVTLAADNVTLNTTGTAKGVVSVTGTGNTTRTVTIDSVTGDGTLSISIAAGSSSDTAGNLSAAANSTAFTVDNTSPTLTIGAPSSTLTAPGPISYTITYQDSTQVSLTSSMVTLNKTGTAQGTIQVTGAGTTTRIVTITDITGNGTLGISIAAGSASDAANNTAAAAGPSATFSVDNTAPAPVISSTEPSPSAVQKIAMSVAFGENVTGFDLADIAVTNGTAGALQGGGNGTFTFDVTPAVDGTVTVNIPAGAVQDSAGNANVASNPFSIVSIRVAPKPAITSTEKSPTKAAAIPIAVNFGAAVTGFTLPDIQVTGGTAAAFVDSGSGQFSLAITPSADGTIVVNIPSGAAQSTTGVESAAAEPFSIVSDRTITIPEISGLNPTTNTLNGTGEAGASLRISTNAGTTLCATSVQDNGAWSCTLAAGADLSQELTIVQTDVAGNVSAPARFTADDGDNVPVDVELKGPNQITDANGNTGADANGDGMVDALQPNVATLPNAENHETVSIEVQQTNPDTGKASTCSKFDFVQALKVGDALKQGGSVPNDPGFQYPFGLLNYAVKCASAGSEEVLTVVFYFYQTDSLSKLGVTAKDYVVRKYTATGSGFQDPQDIGVKFSVEDDPGMAAKAGVANVIKMTLTLKDNGAGDDNPVQNFVLDPVGVALPAPGSVTLQMTANKQQVSVGDIVQYQVRANNATDAALPDISINDLLPAGFRIVPGSARAVAGSTATPLTMTGVEPNVRIGSFTVPGKSNVTVNFSALVGSGVQAGRKMNAATAVTSAGPVSLTATLSIEVVADPILDRMTILGRVFHDRNGNGQMDNGEEGVRGARLITTDGEWIVVDEFGRYNYPGVDAGTNARGRNFILKVEEDSLPRGTTFTTENPRVERITGGAITNMDFGVKLPEAKDASASGSKTDFVRVGAGGRLWLSKAPSERTPRLAILAPEAIYLNAGARPTEALAFWFDSNFSSFIDRWELNFYASDDDGFSNPLYTLSGNKLPIGSPVNWNGDLTSSRLEDHRTLRYRLKIVDSKGNTGWTVPGALSVLPSTLAGGAKAQTSASWFEELNGRNDLSEANFALPPGLVTIMGEGLPAGGSITVGNDVYPIEASGRIALDRRQLPGNFEFATTVRETSGDTIAQTSLSGELFEDDFSLIGLADLTVGGNSLSGAIDLVSDDDHFDKDIFVDGRVAFYLKGRVSGRYLISAQLDTGEDRIGDLLDGANGRNPRDLFRRIDPDRYYPVYGDNSTRGRDINTEGKLYVRLDWDKSSVLWGNFNTGFTGTKLAEYNRGLYGAKVDIRSVAATSNGDEKTVIKAFASEPNTAASHDEFEGTGGSLYYLRHQDLVLGSVKLAVEVRELSSDRVRERIDLQQGPDYELDEFQGRLILTAPLRTVADKRLLTVIRDEALEGDRVILVADYEYVSGDSFAANNLNGGVRAQQTLGDHLTVGGTYIREDNSPTDFEKRAGDITVRGGKNTYVSVEYAETTATQSVEFNTSPDGGLTFVERTPANGPSRGGNATAVDARLDFADYFGKKISGKVGGWFRDQDAGFDALTFTTSASRRRNFGLEGTWDATSAFRLRARYSQDETGIDRLKTAGIQGDYRFSNSLSLGMEYQHREGTAPTLTGTSLFSSLPYDVRGDIFGTRLRWRATDRFSTFVSGQYGANLATTAGSRNNLFGAGTEYRVSEKLSLLGEVFKGSRGDGGRAGAQYNYKQGSAAYLNYTTENSLGTGGGLTLGQRSELTDKLKIYQEHRFDWQSRDPQRTQAYGLGYSFTSSWTVGAEIQRGRARESNQWRNRDAYSVFSSWRNSRSSVNNKLEYRLDDSFLSGTTNQARQWVTANRLTFKINEDVSVMSKLDYSITRGAVSGVSRGRFGEFDLGAAYRPVKNNRLNMLGMYSFVDNLTPQQIPGAAAIQGSFFGDRFHVASVDGTYTLTSRWEAGGKLAWKRTADRADRDTGTFFGSDTKLSVARLRYHFVHKWNGMVEFRQISVSNAQDSRRGFLSAIGYDVTKNIQGGMGYNFTDFNDDLKRLDFRAHGWFLNMSFKY